MISLVEGEGLGAGKSYYVATVMAEHIAQGGTVYTSDDFGIRWEPLVGPMPKAKVRGLADALRSAFLGPWAEPRPLGMVHLVETLYGVTPEREQFVEVPASEVWRIHEVTPPGTPDLPVLIVVDEAQGALGTRDTRDPKKRALFDWCCQSRHDDNDLIFLTQNVNNIDVMLRRLASNMVVVKNLARDGGLPVIGELNRFLWRFMSNDGKRQYGWKCPAFSMLVGGAYESKACRGKHQRLSGEAVGRRKLKRARPRPGRIMRNVALAVLAGVCVLLSL